MVVVPPTESPNSVLIRCVIEVYGGVSIVLSIGVFNFLLGKGAFVRGLSQVFLFLFNYNMHSNDIMCAVPIPITKNYKYVKEQYALSIFKVIFLFLVAITCGVMIFWEKNLRI